MQPFNVLLKPLLSEKSNAVREKTGKYTFVVRMDASKQDVATAVTKMFDVKVANVRTLVTRHRPRRKGMFLTKPNRVKKAVVTLVEGAKIPLFDEQ